MARKYRLGIIGFAHSHVRELSNAFAKLPDIEWVACADTVPAVPSACAKSGTRKHGLRHALEVIKVGRAYEDYREMLAKHSFDIVIFCPENARHGEVAEAIAAAGAHMVTEKPMAASLPEALRMARAAKRHGVELVVNWPIAWQATIRTMKELIDAGTVGDVWEVKWRNGASMGPLAYGTGADVLTDDEKGAEWWHQAATGGGALLDYCCYGACISRWFLGAQAQAAIAMKANLASPYGDAEDNAVITVRFPKALAVLEGTWTTWHTGFPIGPAVYGTRGTMFIDFQTDPATGKPAHVIKVFTTRGGSGEPDRIVPTAPLPAGRANVADEVVHHLETGEPLHPILALEHNLDAMAILDAAIRSAASGKLELVGSPAWIIG